MPPDNGVAWVLPAGREKQLQEGEFVREAL
jgi:hypothetical protein